MALNIFVSLSSYILKNLRNSSVFTTKYNKWNTISRSYLFNTLKYIAATTFITDGSIPKLSSNYEESILNKILEHHKTLLSYGVNNGKYRIYYTRKISGFVQILDFIPTIYDANGNKCKPSELKDLVFTSEKSETYFYHY